MPGFLGDELMNDTEALMRAMEAKIEERSAEIKSLRALLERRQNMVKGMIEAIKPLIRMTPDD